MTDDDAYDEGVHQVSILENHQPLQRQGYALAYQRAHKPLALASTSQQLSVTQEKPPLANTENRMLL
jgi:hypothetical protein